MIHLFVGFRFAFGVWRTLGLGWIGAKAEGRGRVSSHFQVFPSAPSVSKYFLKIEDFPGSFPANLQIRRGGMKPAGF